MTSTIPEGYKKDAMGRLIPIAQIIKDIFKNLTNTNED